MTNVYTLIIKNLCIFRNIAGTTIVYAWFKACRALVAANLSIVLNRSYRFDPHFTWLFFIQDKWLVHHTRIPVFASIVSSIGACVTAMHVHIHVCMYIRVCISRSLHRSSPWHCTAAVYLTVPNVLSKALISHWNAVTKWQLARGILYAPRTCIGTHIAARMLAPTRLSLSSPSLSLSHSHSPSPSSLPLFVTFVLYSLCPRFDSFDSFAMERENAAVRSTVREKPLANDVKVRSAGRIWDHRKFLSCSATRVYRFTFYERIHSLNTFLLPVDLW